MADRAVLEAFERALDREAHNLSRWPEQTWQQLYNRLQWAGDAIGERLAPQREGRTDAAGANPWFRTRTPFRESKALMRTLVGHDDDVEDCAFSPDGRRIVSASHDETLKVWDAESGAELSTLEGHTDWTRGGVLGEMQVAAQALVLGCAFSPDGRRIVSASTARTLKVWDAQNGAEIHTLGGHAGAVCGCAFRPDGRRIVSASHVDRTLKIWDAETGAELRTLEDDTGVRACAFSPDGRRIVSASTDGTLKIWKTESGTELCTLERHTDIVTGCAFSPDGRWIVSAGDRTLRLWKAKKRLPSSPRTLEGHTDFVQGCAFSPDGLRIVSASRDKTLKVWDAESGAELSTLEGHTDVVNACAFSPDGRRIVSASADHTLKVWDAEGRVEPRVPKGHTQFVRGCAFSPDGRQIVSASWRDALKIWDAESGAEIRTIGNVDGWEDCAFSPDGRRIVSASTDGTLKIWKTESGTELCTLERHTHYVTGCAFSPDGRWIASVSVDKSLKVWDAESGAELRTLTDHTSMVSACAFSPDGRWIASAGDTTLRLWKAKRRLPSSPRTLEGHIGVVNACAFSPDGRRIVSASADHTLKVWDAESGAEIHTLGGHAGAVRGCAFSSDGRWIVSAGDKTLRAWAVPTGDAVATLPLPYGLRSLAMHPWLPRVICGDADGGIYQAELEGIEYGPPIITAVDLGSGAAVRCPACWREHPLDESWLGEHILCPTPSCELRLQVNPFGVEPPSWLRETEVGRSRLAAPTETLVKRLLHRGAGHDRGE